jgi:hypothetical protein
MYFGEEARSECGNICLNGLFGVSPWSHAKKYVFFQVAVTIAVVGLKWKRMWLVMH